jgi:hypothetical protein
MQEDDLLRLRRLRTRFQQPLVVVRGVDEGDAEAECDQFLRELQGWRDVPLRRQRDDDCVQRLGTVRLLLLLMLDLHSVHQKQKMMANQAKNSNGHGMESTRF